MRAARLAVALGALIGAAQAQAAADMFLCTPTDAPDAEKWIGESTDIHYKDCVQFEWVGFGAAQAPPPAGGGPPGTPDSVLGPLVFATRVDSNYPKLLTQLATGTVFDVTLYARKAGASTWYLKVDYVDAVIGDLQAAGAGEVPNLTVAIRARTVTYTTRTFDPTNGTQTGEFTATWTAPGP